ncbi:MAG: hypothetical protein KDD66_08030 [Bdellovibrionales bacterium]|nr:hypothetical protein [Bdellovibrionales bacterium]
MDALLQLLVSTKHPAATTIRVLCRTVQNRAGLIESEAGLRLDDRGVGRERAGVMRESRRARRLGDDFILHLQCELRRFVLASECLLRFPENHRREKDMEQRLQHVVPPVTVVR